MHHGISEEDGKPPRGRLAHLTRCFRSILPGRWWGSHCVDGWLSANPGRWDIVTYQFGLHDLALDNERVEPNNVYAE